MSERVEQIINNFKAHLQEDNLKQLTTQAWKAILSKELAFIFTTRPYKLDPKFLYRARPNFDNGKKVDFFYHTSELWAPPKNKIKSQGRCNMSGQSILYCSSCSTTTLFEIKPDAGAEVTIIEYQTIGDLSPLSVVGVKEVMSVGDDFLNIFGNHFEASFEETIITDNILSAIFKSRTPDTINYPIYNLTNAIMQIFLHHQKIEGIPDNLIPPKNIGLIYPSVETHKVLGINIAVEPNAVKSLLKPIQAYRWSIIKKHDEHHYEIKLTHRTNKIFPNGEMKWRVVIDSNVEYITDL